MRQRVLIVGAILLAIAIAIWATTENQMIVRVEKGPELKTLQVQMANLQHERTKLVIQDMDGINWVTQYIWEEDGYNKLFRLDEMPPNAYFVAVHNEVGYKLQAFAMEDEDFTFFHPAQGKTKAVYTSYGTADTAGLITNFKPKGGGTITVQLANLMGEETMLQFGSWDEPRLLREYVNHEQGYAKDWKLLGKEEGHYFFFIKAKDLMKIQPVLWEGGKIVLGEPQELERREMPVPEPALTLR